MMKTRALMLLKKHPPDEPPPEAPLEWLVTNGLGGYAAGSVLGPPLRRFHGLLIAAAPAPLGRLLLLHQLQESVQLQDGPPVDLRAGPDAHPTASLADFFLQGGLPHWTFALDSGARVEQALLMPHDQNTVHVRYRLTGTTARGRLRLRPWLDIRPHEGFLSPAQAHRYTVTARGPVQFEFEREQVPVLLRMTASAERVSFATDPADWNEVRYAIEHDRGYDFTGSMHAPGAFTLDLHPDRDVFLTASSEPWARLDALGPEAAWQLELTRRERLIGASHAGLQAADTYLLALAADQFIIRPATREVGEAPVRAAGAEPRTVIAGYPWFTDWGRDTMIALEGLTLVTGRFREARDILHTFAHHVHQGLIPNLFPEGDTEGQYHTADATLWFFHALDRYDVVTGDHSLVQELLPALEDIVDWHRRGTLFGIRVDADGLLTQGTPDLPLTWMDAKVSDWVVTPRRGKPVEINALWHNALILLGSWLVRDGRGLLADGIAREARRSAEAFNSRFWNPGSDHLFDLVDGEHGNDDTCRPNQVLAIAVTHSPLEQRYWEPVLRAVADELLTPVGLRTLSPRHADYKARYFGDLRARDAAYHQGTVWPWLLGPFVDAWIRVHPDDVEGARDLLAPLLYHVVSGGCVGSISEIFDGQPPYAPRGCFAQAWSVAEAARLLARLSAAHGEQANEQAANRRAGVEG
jgi:predicted glycogen debranching enzyme